MMTMMISVSHLTMLGYIIVVVISALFCFCFITVVVLMVVSHNICTLGPH